MNIEQGITDVLIKVDNQGANNLAKNPFNHQRSKHIDLKYHFIRSEIQAGTIKLNYVPTDENVADISVYETSNQTKTD